MLTLLQLALPSVGATVVTAVAYSFVVYGMKYMKDGRQWTPKLFLRTALTGLLVGVVAAVTNTSLTLTSVQSIAASVGAVHLAEVLIDAAVAQYRSMTASNDTKTGK